MKEPLKWKIHTYGVLKEILDQDSMWMFNNPLNILLDLLRQVAQRATELNDLKLNQLMIRLSLYSISNPDDSEFNPELVSKILEMKKEGKKGK